MKAVIFSKNWMNAKRIEEQIYAAGFKEQIETISSIDEIFRGYEKHHIDVAFLDVDEDETDWQGACKMINFADSNIWLVLMSKNAFAAAKAFELGASDYFVKPIGKKQLERTISRWKTQAIHRNSAPKELIGNLHRY